MEATTIKRKGKEKDKLSVIEEELDKKTVNHNKRDTKDQGSSNMSKKSMKSPLFLTKTSEDSTKISTNRVVIRINKIQSSKIYQVIYFIIYYWLALNDHFRLLFVGKNGDTPFLVFTVMFLSKSLMYKTRNIVIFTFDILWRSIAESGYFFRFFFFVDLSSMFIIAWSSFVSDISTYIILSFLKIIMIVKVTELVVTYKQVMLFRFYRF